MIFSKRLRFSAIVGAIFLMLFAGLAPVPAKASTATGSLLVSATVLSVCLVVATPLAFGTYDGSATSPSIAQATILVTCSNGTPFAVAMGAGTGAGATVASHYMSSGANLLNYMLYTNSARTTLWGDGTNSTSTVSGTGGLLPISYTVYGSIPVAQYVPTGLYGDSVTVTVTY